MSIEAVKKYFREKGIENRILEFSESSATVDLAALAIGCPPERIAKSIALMGADSPILIVAAGNARIDNSKFKQEFGLKAKMLTPEQTLELVGHAVGGVCPFAVKDGVKVYLDRSLEDFDYVYPACGSSNSAIQLTIPELKDLSGYIKTVDVCKIPVPEQV